MRPVLPMEIPIGFSVDERQILLPVGVKSSGFYIHLQKAYTSSDE